MYIHTAGCGKKGELTASLKDVKSVEIYTFFYKQPSC